MSQYNVFEDENNFGDKNIEINPAQNQQQTRPEMWKDQIEHKDPSSGGMVYSNSGNNVTEEISKSTMNIINNYLGFIGKYFNIEFSDFLSRWKGAMIPFNKDFYKTAETNPDLYGPFWIFTTIIFLITVIGNFSGYLQGTSGEKYTYNYDFFPFAALFIYGFGFGAPVIVCLISKFVFKLEIGIVMNICVYGYSFLVLIPIMFLIIIPYGIVETILWIYFIVHSSVFWFYNTWLIIDARAPKARYVILVIFGIVQCSLFCGLKFYFFSGANMYREK